MGWRGARTRQEEDSHTKKFTMRTIRQQLQGNWQAARRDQNGRPVAKSAITTTPPQPPSAPINATETATTKSAHGAHDQDEEDARRCATEHSKQHDER